MRRRLAADVEERGTPEQRALPEGERRAFRTTVAELRQHDLLLEWQARMQPWRGAPFDAALTTRVVRGSHGQITSIRWVIQNLTARKQGEEQPRARTLDFEQRIDEFIGQSGDRPPANNTMTDDEGTGRQSVTQS